MCGWLPGRKCFFGVMVLAGVRSCVRRLRQTWPLPLMRSTDRLPIIPTGFSPDDECGFYRSGRALSITPIFTLANVLTRDGLAPYACGGAGQFLCSVERRFSVPACFQEALRAAAVNTSRRLPPQAARSGVDGCEHSARLWGAGPLMRLPPRPAENPRLWP